MSVPLSSMLAPTLLRRSPFSPVKNNHANKGKNKENSSRLHSVLASSSSSPIRGEYPEVCRGLSNENGARRTYARWHERTRSRGRIYPERMSGTSLSE